jgi:RNA polymerase sigma factor (sigma-70 family)
MNEQSDAELLRAYAESRSEAAFGELVRRYVDLVYSAARRMVCDPHLAEDVTQGVFMALAKGAGQLVNRPTLSGWLHRTAQNIAATTVRNTERRRAREQEAAAMNPLPSAGPDISWDHIAPHLDDAIGELSEPDRDALLLRYFERKSARDMAAKLGISEEAAQKRVSRAVERLRELFAKRGVPVGASGLVIVLAANAVQAAPAGLAVTITAVAPLAGAAIATAATVTTKAIAMTTLQKTIVTAVLTVAVGAGIYEANQAARWRATNKTLTAERDKLLAERDAAVGAAAQAATDSAQAQQDRMELLRLRGEVGMLRQLTNNLAKLPGQAAQQRLQAPGAATSSETASAPLEYVPRDQYAFAGYANPEAAVKSMHWIMSQGDVRSAFAMHTPEGQENLKAQWGNRTEAEISTGIINDNDNKKVLGYRITKQEVISHDEVVVSIYQEGRNQEKKMRLQKIGNEWKYAGPPRMPR